ncbi:carotenoid oxygenase family protein [Paraburkholderia sp. 32]|uniref:carotenoid oxygenase family protein n=1 Tax=Paraburkholderia sp. 32 TaxID=2991057 RepID=UPI003D222537
MSTNVEQAAVFPVTHRPGLPFPDVPRFQGWIRPSRIEGDIFDLEVVQGSVPRELNGRFYTMAADTQFSPRLGDDVFFNGDGMIRMFTIADGHVDYRSRYVMTEKLRAERSARRALFGAYRNPFTDDPSVAGVNRGNANTAFVFSGGKLLTLKEDARPVAVDPVTLETQGEWAFNGKLTSKTFTAHPKIDQRTGEMFFFGYEAKGLATRDIAYYVAGPDGQITHEAWLQAPYVGFMHDFVVSDDYVIFTVFPATADLDRLKAGGQHWRWDPKCDTYLGVMPRRGTAADVRWFTGPPRWAYHFFNSSNDGTAITIDACVGEAISAPCFYPDTYGSPIDPPKTVTRITRWTLDYNNPDAGFQEHILDNNYADYPSVDPRKQTARHRVGFAAIVHPHDGELDLDSSDSNLRAMGLNAVIRYDFVENRVVSRFVPGRQSSIQEPLFIPRGPDAPEGDGWLIMLVDRWNTMLNDLVIVDTADLGAGPVATVSLPMRLPTGVHTLWLDNAELTKASR